MKNLSRVNLWFWWGPSDMGTSFLVGDTFYSIILQLRTFFETRTKLPKVRSFYCFVVVFFILQLGCVHMWRMKIAPTGLRLFSVFSYVSMSVCPGYVLCIFRTDSRSIFYVYISLLEIKKKKKKGACTHAIELINWWL